MIPQFSRAWDVDAAERTQDMNDSVAAGTLADEPTAVAAEEVVVRPGDRLLSGLWIALALVVMRALLQLAVDALKDGERGQLLLEHFTEHLVEATGRAWLIVPPLTLLPRTRSAWTAALRELVAAGIAVALLAGWPDGVARYTPGIDTTRSLLGWAAIAVSAAFVVVLDRFATSPRRGFFRWSPPTRFMATALVLLMGGGAIATMVQVLDWRRKWMAVDGIIEDLYELQPSAKSESATRVQVERGSLLADVRAEATSGSKPAVVMGTSAWVEYDLAIPPDASLSFSCAIDRGSVLAGAPRQQIRFAVAVDGRELFTREIEPQQVAADRRWQDCSLPLDDFANRRVRVRFATSATGQELDGVRVGFGRPLLIRTKELERNAISSERLNLVVVVVDSLRRDHVGCYGYAREPMTTPTLDKLAREGVLFEQARAPASWAAPSVASLFTGRWPPSHGVVDLDRCFLSDSLISLAEVLQANGLTTLGCSANPRVTRANNFQQGFEVWREFPREQAPRLAEQFCDWVRRYKGYQFFAVVHFTDPHRAFMPPPEIALKFARPEPVALMRSAVFTVRQSKNKDGAPVADEEEVAPDITDRDYADLYDGELRCVDDAIEQMWLQLHRTYVEGQNLWSRTVFVVVGSHGEVLGKTAPPLGSSLADDFLDVPLVIRDPRRLAERVHEVVDTTFLPVTLAALLDAKPLPGWPVPASLPPWGSAKEIAYAHTARALLQDVTAPAELLGLENDDFRLLMRPEGTITEFADRRGVGAEAERRKAALAGKLQSWFDKCRREAVSRPLEAGH
jgi:arylsulfatase A-like enzyme